MNMEQMRRLSDEELKKISLKKNGRGNYTLLANKAMRIRRERAGNWDNVERRSPSFEDMLKMEEGYDPDCEQY